MHIQWMHEKWTLFCLMWIWHEGSAYFEEVHVNKNVGKCTAYEFKLRCWWQRKMVYVIFKKINAVKLSLTLSNLSLFLTCCAINREPSIVFSISRMYGLSKVGLKSAGQQPGLISPLPDGLKRSSSAPGSGSAEGRGGPPKQGAMPPAAAKSKRCEAGSAAMKLKWKDVIRINYGNLYKIYKK